MRRRREREREKKNMYNIERLGGSEDVIFGSYVLFFSHSSRVIFLQKPSETLSILFPFSFLSINLFSDIENCRLFDVIF